MSIWGHRLPGKLIAALVVTLTLGVFAVALSRPAAREITLVTRGMAFYVDGDDLPNPTLMVKAGERVRFVVRNEDRGILHDFAVPGVRAALDPLGWNESSQVTFEVPRTPGAYEYHCRPHRMMMRGTILVQ
jgi:plastocyanin